MPPPREARANEMENTTDAGARLRAVRCVCGTRKRGAARASRLRGLRGPRLADQVDEKTQRALDAFRQLAKEGEARVDVGAFADGSDDEAAGEVLLSRVAKCEDGREP